MVLMMPPLLRSADTSAILLEQQGWLARKISQRSLVEPASAARPRQCAPAPPNNFGQSRADAQPPWPGPCPKPTGPPRPGASSHGRRACLFSQGRGRRLSLAACVDKSPAAPPLPGGRRAPEAPPSLLPAANCVRAPLVRAGRGLALEGLAREGPVLATGLPRGYWGRARSLDILRILSQN